MIGGESKKEERTDGLDRLVEILTKPEKQILPLLYSNSNSNEDEDGNKESDLKKNKTLNELLDISKTLFADIESLGKQYQKLHIPPNHTDTHTTAECTVITFSGCLLLIFLA